MGYRVHYAKLDRVEWAGGSFNWQSDQFAEMVRAELDKDCDYYISEDEQTLELYPEDLQKYVNILRGKPSDEKSKYFDEYTVGEEADALQEMLDGYDKHNETIRLEWF